jgi:GR25 family glycosyltransferase involved in LPS biosynthesis
MISKTQAYVITIMSNDRSCTAANRCMESAKKFGMDCHMWAATTPADNIKLLFEKEGIDPSRFNEEYSRLENCMAAFYSHYTLWKKCVELGHEITIFEHDAVVVERVPDFIDFKGCVNLGKPSYGKFKTPKKIGVNPLTSKTYLPGAHAYRITTAGAKKFIEAAKTKAEPTDVFIRLENFSWLEEFYPWPVECKDTFTTIQHEKGCAAKHGYNKDYIIEEGI